MKISHNWLRELVDCRIKPAELAQRLSMQGLEVERYEEQAKAFEGFVVGEVLEKSKHPQADKLVVCKVNIGTEVLDIVCGAPNVAVGQKVAVALVGATIQHNQHDPKGKPFVLGTAKISGVESKGMICSEYELGLGDNADGIMVIDGKTRVGISLAAALARNDVIYEMEITANRGDWLSHIGVAREVGALIGKKASLPKVKMRESREPVTKHARVKILDRKNCTRYTARVVRNLKIHPSPRWLQDRLLAVSIRPINNVVDVTNYVMMETGQPLHAFDYDTLNRQTIVVRAAAEGEQFTTLDGKERRLNAETLLICDGEKPIAIAGVMGGANSEISDSTTNVLIESAHFRSANIRRTSKYLALSTDASQRFERGTDIDMTVVAAHRAAQLIQEISGAEVLKGVVDAYPKKLRPRRITVRVSRVNSILGTSLSRDQVHTLLKSLEIVPVSAKGDRLSLSIPSFRNDLVEEIDIIEEVARAYGYNKIETKTRAAIEFSQGVQADTFQQELREYLVGSGFHETLTDSLLDRETIRLVREPEIEVLNPVSADMAILRTSLIPGALNVVRHNISHGSSDLRIFELGHVFSSRVTEKIAKLDDCVEQERLIFLITGNIESVRYGVRERFVDFFDLKGEVENLLAKFLLDKYRFISYDSRSPLTEYQLGLEINGTYAGFLGKIDKQILSRFEIEQDVYASELVVEALETWTKRLLGFRFPKNNIDSENFSNANSGFSSMSLGVHRNHLKHYLPIPKFPSVRRDLALVVDQHEPNGRVEQALRESGSGLLTDVTLFDVYSGDQVGPGKKSLAYALEFQPRDRTYTDREIDQVVSRMLDHLQKQLNAKLRG